MATRRPASKPKGEDWTGRRVSFRNRPSDPPQSGTVVRMASGKNPAAWVAIDGRPSEQFCYVKDLEELK